MKSSGNILMIANQKLTYRGVMAMPITFNPTKQREFLIDPLNFYPFLTPQVAKQNYPVKKNNDYREEISEIKKKILQSNFAHYEVVKKHVLTHIRSVNNKKTCPVTYLSNSLGIYNITEHVLETSFKYSTKFEPLIIETGNLIHAALRANQLDVYYFDSMEKIIVLSSSMHSFQDIELIFEKYAFTTGFHPIVESNRTKFGDITIHISDKSPPRTIPFKLPEKEELFDYLFNNELVNFEVSGKLISIIVEVLENKCYTPQNTIYILAKDLLQENILLGYNQVTALESALVRYPKGVPSTK